MPDKTSSRNRRCHRTAPELSSAIPSNQVLPKKDTCCWMDRSCAETSSAAEPSEGSACIDEIER